MSVPCDYNHYDESGVVEKPADYWTLDCDNRWTPLCAPCLPEFWYGEDRAHEPILLYPIANVPDGPKRLTKMADR